MTRLTVPVGEEPVTVAVQVVGEPGVVDVGLQLTTTAAGYEMLKLKTWWWMWLLWC